MITIYVGDDDYANDNDDVYVDEDHDDDISRPFPMINVNDDPNNTVDYYFTETTTSTMLTTFPLWRSC